MKFKIFFSFLLIASVITAQSAKDPLEIAKSIADKVMHDTPFILKDVEQKPVEGIQVIDFGKAGVSSKNAFAFSKIKSEKDGTFKLGISYSAPVEINVNGKIIYQKKKGTRFFFHEIAYSMFVFNDTISLALNKGINNIYIKSSGAKNNFIYLRELTTPQDEVTLQFMPINEQEKDFTWPWCFVSQNKLDENIISNLFETGTAKNITCIYPKPNTLKDLQVPDDAAFKRDAYTEWHYA